MDVVNGCLEGLVNQKIKKRLDIYGSGHQKEVRSQTQSDLSAIKPPQDPKGLVLQTLTDVY